MESNLYKKLIEYSRSDYYGFHMPGHKRNTNMVSMENPYSFDITEITGFDNLHNPDDIIKEEMEIAREYYGSKKTYFLVNGSTGGNLAAISSVAKSNDKIIMARNCHKSVYNAVELLKVNVEFIYPQLIEDKDIFGAYSIENIKSVIENNKDAKAIFITSPTYEGIVSDVEKICEIAHRNNMPVIVDSAHGAHFILSEEFPKSALECGADIVVESLHKTLPSLTQTALLHFNSDIISKKKLEKYLATYQSSSPSYVLMSSICNCINWMKNEGNKRVQWFSHRLDKFYLDMKGLENIEVLSMDEKTMFDFDKTKIVIYVKNNLMSGLELKNILNSCYHLELEMASGMYVLAMTSVCDTEEAFNRLEKALFGIDKMLDSRKTEEKSRVKLEKLYNIRNKKVCEIYQVDDYFDSNEIAKTYTYLYPPGIPIIVPGEVVDNRVIKLINEYKKSGYEVIEV